MEDNKNTGIPSPAAKPAESLESPRQGALTLVLTGFVYLIFHLRLGQSIGASCAATLGQMLLTAPYAIGFTCILVYLHRRISGQKARPPWTRLLRIFFTMGICFALFFALYEYGGGDPWNTEAASAGGFWGNILQKLQWR